MASFDTADEFYLHNFCIPSQKANKCKVLLCSCCLRSSLSIIHNLLATSLLAATNSSSTTMEQHPVTSVQPCDCCVWNVSAGRSGHADTLHMHADNVTSVRVPKVPLPWKTSSRCSSEALFSQTSPPYWFPVTVYTPGH